jgi:hypothetical protein
VYKIVNFRPRSEESVFKNLVNQSAGVVRLLSERPESDFDPDAEARENLRLFAPIGTSANRLWLAIDLLEV